MTISPHRHEEPSLPRVFGRYLLVQRLSSGGMGEIFLAKHGLSGFEKLCVIKKVLPHLAADRHFISRFVDEAQVAIHLQHANVAQVFEVGQIGDEYFLALEYVEGRDLRRCLSTLGERSQRFPLDMALLIARDMANGLAYAHRRTGPNGESLELVHCDISPPNVLISFEGEIKIIDFGIAKSAVRVTDDNPRMGFGKFGYMAPEQLVRGGEIDRRTDIYAAGAVLFELLTGVRLYSVPQNPDFRELARQVVQGEHPRPSDLDPELGPYDGLVLKAVAPRAPDRFQSAAELRDAIQHVLVRINPTAASDSLGSFMRQLFAQEVEDERRLAERVRATDMRVWQDQLAHQASSTVSFALLPEPDKQPAPSAGHMPAVVHTGSSTALAPRTGRPRTLLLAAVMLAVAAGGALALVGRLDATEQNSADAPLGSAPAPDAGPARQTPVVAALTERDAGAPVDAEAPARPDATPAEDEHTAVRDKRRRRHTPRHEPDPKQPDPKQQPDPKPEVKELSRADVESQFRTVNREYRSFQQSYGARLDDRWADLMHAIQYAQTPDKLRAVSKQLDDFRGEMRRIKAGSE